MLILLIKYLENFNIKIPQVFLYTSTRMILASISSIIITFFVAPFFIKKLYELKIGEKIRSKKECPLLFQLHKKKENTPTMGGVLILFSILFSLFLWMDLRNIFTIILFITTIFLGALGGIDDYLKLKYKNKKGIKPKLKFFFQFIFSFFIASYLLFFSDSSFQKKDKKFFPIIKEKIEKKKMKTLNVKEYFSRIYIPFYKKPLVCLKGVSSLLLILFIMFVIVGSSNAVNLTDGLDGLAIGCIAMVAAVLSLFAFLSNNIEISKYLNMVYVEGSGEIAVYLSSLIGASLGFLWYNGYPAQIFMGDIGSLSLGGVLGVIAVLLRRELLLALVGGVFVVEAFSVILQVLSYKFRGRKRIFLCAPLHHHFEYKGWAEPKVVLRFWIIALFFAVIGIASIKFQ
ncbi:MAG: phospho-N-acetylmuramoyl-pentapeptide-transferase [Chlamydiae bacterium SM23_39]|nr:MAG: phospho-N-acetylmuramoyl-pentapeptide-transferase [Chlamydiae bacterium SM23_39]